MRLTSKAALVAVAAALVVAAGCAKDPQATPKGTVTKMYDALVDNDKASFVECLKVSDEQRPFVEAMFDIKASGFALQNALRKEYGDEGLETFLRAVGSDQGEDWQSPTRDEIKRTTVKVDGDTATASTPGDDNPGILVKEKGRWYITLPSEITQGRTATLMLKMAAPLKTVSDTTRGLVGNADQTPETLGAAFGAESLKVTTGIVMKSNERRRKEMNEAFERNMREIERLQQ